MEFEIDNILVIDAQAAAMRPPAFERSHKAVVVVSPGHAELRQFEAIGWHENRYKVHTEHIPAPSGATLNFDSFREVFSRQYAKDSLDPRKAVKMAMKVAYR